MSGIRPDSVNGRSISGHLCEQIPFWPARDANLSPMVGFRGIRIVTQATFGDLSL